MHALRNGGSIVSVDDSGLVRRSMRLSARTLLSETSCFRKQAACEITLGVVFNSFKLHESSIEAETVEERERRIDESIDRCSKAFKLTQKLYPYRYWSFCSFCDKV